MHETLLNSKTEISKVDLPRSGLPDDSISFLKANSSSYNKKNST